MTVLGKQIYSKHQFKIYTAHGGQYVVHNSQKSFKDGHTHVYDYSTARYLVFLAYNMKLPKRLPQRLLVSLLRVSRDKDYTQKLSALVINKENYNAEFKENVERL